MRRQTLIAIIVLVAMIGAAAIAQIAVVGGDDPLPGPTSPGALPSVSPTAPPA